MMRNINNTLRIIAVLFTYAQGSPTKPSSNINRQTCNSTFLGENGFDVCLFGATGNLLTNLLSVLANDIWYIQNAIALGKCYCNQNCIPSQIVCENAPALQNVLEELGLASDNPLQNQLAQLVYAVENWSAYCYCPKFISQEEACAEMATPQPCNIPHGIVLEEKSNANFLNGVGSILNDLGL